MIKHMARIVAEQAVGVVTVCWFSEAQCCVGVARSSLVCVVDCG
jgi:hypothetical protein